MIQESHLDLVRHLQVLKSRLEMQQYENLSLVTHENHLLNVQSISESAKIVIKQIREEINNRNYGLAISKIDRLCKAILKVVFSFKCDKTFQSLTPTSQDGVRFCKSCKKNVYRVTSEKDFHIRGAAGQCVYFDRKDGKGYLDSPVSCSLEVDQDFVFMGSPGMYEDPFENVLKDFYNE